MASGGDPADGLVDELEALGAAVEIVADVGDLRREGNAGRLVAAALDRFGRLDSAAWFTGRVYGGTVTDGSLEALEKNVAGNLIAPLHALQSTLQPMIEQGSGQVLLITSAAGLKPTPGAGLYSATRAGANMLARNAAAEVAQLCGIFLDGTSRFQTGQVVGFDGGWSSL